MCNLRLQDRTVLTQTNSSVIRDPSCRRLSPYIPYIMCIKRVAELLYKHRQSAVRCQNLKVFTCTAPYPVDVFVRLSLRERGWVEKFGPRMICAATSAETTDRMLQCSTDEGNVYTWTLFSRGGWGMAQIFGLLYAISVKWTDCYEVCVAVASPQLWSAGALAPSRPLQVYGCVYKLTNHRPNCVYNVKHT